MIDVGSFESGEPFIVMEYLPGKDLAQILRDGGPLTVHDAVDYVLQVCAALAEAHAAGIIHRDLKPANLFLAERDDTVNVVKVVDFGISKVTAGPSTGKLTAPTRARDDLTSRVRAGTLLREARVDEGG